MYFFNWRIIALQNFVVFCQTSTWISHRYTYVPFLLNLPPISLILKIFIFNCRVVALQYGLGYCHTLMWISCRYIYVPSLLNLPPTASPTHPSRLSEHWFELPESYSKCPRAICFTYVRVYVSMLRSPFVPPSLPPLCPQVCSLCLSLHCCPANRLISTILLEFIYMR